MVVLVAVDLVVLMVPKVLVLLVVINVDHVDIAQASWVEGQELIQQDVQIMMP